MAMQNLFTTRFNSHAYPIQICIRSCYLVI